MSHFSGHWSLVFGVLGNIVSFMVFLAPVPTFYQIYKKKSTEGFQSIPYVIALFSAMLWMYYAFLKTNTTLLITINSFGCFIETIYIAIYLIYGTKKAKMQTTKLLVLLNIVGFGLIVMVSQFALKGPNRAHVVGWICLVFALCVFVAPLCILRRVIKTKSVEYMPFLLSLFLTLSAVFWFFYGLSIHDFNVAIPNVLGFAFGVIQMVLYAIYKDTKKSKLQKLPETQGPLIVLDEERLRQLTEQIINLVKLNGVVSLEKVQLPAPKTNHEINGAVALGVAGNQNKSAKHGSDHGTDINV